MSDPVAYPWPPFGNEERSNDLTAGPEHLCLESSLGHLALLQRLHLALDHGLPQRPVGAGSRESGRLSSLASVPDANNGFAPRIELPRRCALSIGSDSENRSAGM